MSDNIYVTSGDDYLDERRLLVNVVDAGLAVELTGADMTFEVRRRRSDAEALISKTVADGIEIANPQAGDTLGVAYITLAGEDTDALAGRYYWELEAVDQIGTITLGAGIMYVEGDQIHPVTLDAIAHEPQFIDHLAPVWRALPAAIRGTFYVDPALVERARSRGIEATARPRPQHAVAYPPPQLDGRPALVASYGDVKEGRRLGYGPFAFIEHGIGQSYGNRTNGSYAGGPDRLDNTLILVPNGVCAQTWRAAYPEALIEIVGSPRIDDLPGREGDGEPPTIALSFHWPAPLSVSGLAGTAFGDYLPQLERLAAGFHVIGHAHPKGDWPRQMERQYTRLGIPFVKDFDDVCRQADIYVCDNSSTIYEFASTGRPVVLLNARAWTRKANYGLRFWDAASVGENIWPDADLPAAVARGLDDGPAAQSDRETALGRVYQPRTGGAALAAAAIAEWLG